MLAKTWGITLYTPIEQGGAGRRQDGGLGRCGSRAEDHQQQQMRQDVAEARRPKTEWPSTDRTSPWLEGLPSPIPVVPTPAGGLGGEDDDDVGQQQQDTVEMTPRPVREPWRGSAVSSLTDSGGVPSPEDEQHQQDTVDEW